MVNALVFSLIYCPNHVLWWKFLFGSCLLNVIYIIQILHLTSGKGIIQALIDNQC